jgi:hypothetical protein
MKAPDSVSPLSSRKGGVWIAVGLALAVFGVFDLPWIVPFPGPVAGESYSYGCYNPVAVLALYGAFVPVLLGLLRSEKKPVALDWFIPSPVIFPSWRKAALDYILLGVATLICTTVILLWNAYLTVPYWNESGYFLSNIDLVRLGYRPYTDFTFMYGPAFLYGPIAVDWISGGSLGIENAYAICVALAYALGFLLFFILLRFLNLPDRDRPWILALTLMVWFLVTMGLQFTPLRFGIVPCVLALGNHPRLFRAPVIPAAARHLVLVTVFNTASYLVSPEMGIACSVGFAAGAVVHFLSRRVLSAVACLTGIGFSLALIAGFSARYLDAASAMARGACCFPICPSIANLILVLAALYVVPMVACAILRQPGHPAAPLAAAVGSAAVLLLPAALGRCDLGHVLFNGLVLYLLLFAGSAQVKRSYLIAWGAVFAVVFVVLTQISYWTFFWSQWQMGIADHAFYRQHPPLVEAWSRAWKNAAAGSPHFRQMNWDKVAPFPTVGLSLAASSDTIAAPLGADASLDRLLKIRAAFIPPYYSMLYPGLLFTPQDASRLVEQTRARYDFLLIPDGDLRRIVHDINHPPDGTDVHATISGLLMYPVPRKFGNDPYLPEVAVAEALLPNSKNVSDDGTYLFIKLAK